MTMTTTYKFFPNNYPNNYPTNPTPITPAVEQSETKGWNRHDISKIKVRHVTETQPARMCSEATNKQRRHADLGTLPQDQEYLIHALLKWLNSINAGWVLKSKLIKNELHPPTNIQHLCFIRHQPTGNGI